MDDSEKQQLIGSIARNVMILGVLSAIAGVGQLVIELVRVLHFMSWKLAPRLFVESVAIVLLLANAAYSIGFSRKLKATQDTTSLFESLKVLGAQYRFNVVALVFGLAVVVLIILFGMFMRA